MWLSSWKPQGSFLATAACTVLCMRYANVTDRPQQPARLKQASFARVDNGQHLHASEHEDEEQVCPRLFAAWTYQVQRRKTASCHCQPLLCVTCKKFGSLGKHPCTTLVLNDGDFLHPCNHQILAALPGTELDLILEGCRDKLA